MTTPNYHYIIAGMGCAGLSLAVQLSRAGLTRGKKILLVDREKKERNDRTWSFWETGPGPFEDIVCKKWDDAWFHSQGFSSLMKLAPYSYKMIRGIDFFDHCMDLVRQDPAFEIMYQPVEKLGNTDAGAYCTAGGRTYSCEYLFNSILFTEPAHGNGTYCLLQHFKGWVIETPEPCFDPLQATLMDFRPSQEHGTTFVYVMPFSGNKALIEYTLFTAGLLEQQQYDAGLDDYVRNILGIRDWQVKEEEFGIIPMTNHRFVRRDGHILNIGTAGGRTKASSGYTFRFIQKDTADIIRALGTTGHPFTGAYGYSRFDWYDSVLLNILSNGTLPGDRIFTELFRNNKPGTILSFLDNETSFGEELGILLSLPQFPFMKAGVQEFGKLVSRGFV